MYNINIYYIYVYINISLSLYVYICITSRFLYTTKKLRVYDIHYVPKCLSCHKAILVMSGRTYYFHHEYICVMFILLLRGLTTLSFECCEYIYCLICLISKSRSYLGQTLIKVKQSEKYGKICRNMKFTHSLSSLNHSVVSTTKYLGKIRKLISI